MTESSLATLDDVIALTRRSTIAPSADYCFLVLAHTDAEQVRHLLSALQHPRVSVILHLDAKSSLSSFTAKLDGLKNCTVLLDRLSINWGGYAMVEAMLQLLRSGVEHTRARRFTFLSGADFPIRPIDDFVIHFENDEHEFVPARVIDDSHPMTHRFTRPHIQGYVPFLNSRHRKQKLESALQRAIAPSIGRQLEDLGGQLMAAAKPFDNLYKGSQWMSMTRSCAEEMLVTLEARPEIETFFRYTAVPDESMIQTIIMHSSRKHLVSGTPLHYVSWQRMPGGGPQVATLTPQDYPAITDSRCWFARKLTTGTSGNLSEMLLQRKARPTIQSETAERS